MRRRSFRVRVRRVFSRCYLNWIFCWCLVWLFLFFWICVFYWCFLCEVLVWWLICLVYCWWWWFFCCFKSLSCWVEVEEWSVLWVYGVCLKLCVMVRMRMCVCMMLMCMCVWWILCGCVMSFNERCDFRCNGTFSRRGSVIIL